MEEYIQVGVIAARAPDGSFLPSKPIYVKRTPEQLSDILNNRRWLRAGELERIRQATA